MKKETKEKMELALIFIFLIGWFVFMSHAPVEIANYAG